MGLSRIAMSRGPAPGDFAVVSHVNRLARELSVDILHGHGAKGGAYARLASRSLKRGGKNSKSISQTQCVYTPHGGSLHYHPSTLKGRVYMNLERYLAKHTDAIAFESAYSAKVYDRQIGLPPCLTSIIPNGLLPEEFEQVVPAEDASDFLFIGELRQLKGIDVLLHALKEMQGPQPVTATIVGAGPDQEQFRSLCMQLGLDDVVQFPGALPARQAFALGRAMVIPSRAESFPYIVLESAAAGLPIIATNVGGIPEITGDTETQLLPPGDVVALAGALRDLQSRPDVAAARATQLKSRIASRFTVAAMTTGVTALYDKVSAA